MKNKKIKRLWINSLEVEEVRKGFNSLLDNSKDLLMYEEAKARQISDWLVGMNASQLYSLLMHEKGVNMTLSVGRVQSPLCYLIYQRQKEIEQFVSKPFFELVGEFKTANGMYMGKAKNIRTDTIEPLQSFGEDNGCLLDSEISGMVVSVEKKEKRVKSPKLHSLSTLQTVANKKWKYSPAKVLEVMQSLYEKKLVTYPRTDSNYITENEFLYLVENLERYKELLNVTFEANLKVNKRYVDNSKVQEHYAIIPTKTIPSDTNLNGLTTEEKSIYEEIVLTTLAMFHRDYVYEETKILTSVNDIEFESIGKVEIDKGWKLLFTKSVEGIEKKEDDPVLPVVVVDEKVTSLLHSKEACTSPPKPYTEGGLINLMKTSGKMVEDEEDSAILKEIEGIGTEATRASIIETVKKNGYIDINKNIVSITKKGELLCEAIHNTMLASPAMTAKWESYLKKIGEGSGTKEVFVAQTKRFISDLLETAPAAMQEIETVSFAQEQQTDHFGSCPSCRKGTMIDRKTFIGCSNYRNGCKFTINRTILGKKLTDKQVTDLLEKGTTSMIKGFTSKAGKSFDAKLTITDGKVSFVFEM